MANKKTGKTTSAKTTKQVAKPAEETVVKTSITETTAKPAETPVKRRLSDIDMNELIEVQNITYGGLHYESREGYVVDWIGYGDTQLIPNSELLKMRNQQPAFFTTPWVKLVGDNAEATISYLQVEKFYNPITKLSDFSELLECDPEDITAMLTDVGNSTKEAVARYAYAKVQSGELDNLKVIKAIESAVGYVLEE